MTFYGKMVGFLNELLRGKLRALAGVIQVLYGCEFFTIILARECVSLESDGH